MVESVDFHALYTQLQTRYPGSGLISELVQVQSDQYVVKASIQIGATTLVTGLAAAMTVEQAEDQARLRALGLIGVIPLGFVGNSGISMPAYLPPLSPQTVAASPSLASVSPISSPPLPESVTPPVTAPLLNLPSPAKPEQAAQLEQEVPFLNLTEPLAEQEQEGLTVVPEKSLQPKISRSRGRKDINQDSFVPPEQEIEADVELDSFAEGSYNQGSEFVSEPIDLSELIALTDVEMERVGWSKKRGQAHLKQIYGKQTRAELDEEQLLEFLHYLRALPSKS